MLLGIDVRIIYFGKPTAASEQVLLKIGRQGATAERMPAGALQGMHALDGAATQELCILLSHSPDTLHMVRELRRNGSTSPALVLHESLDGAASAAHLDAGADDVLSSSLDGIELAARIRAATRRASGVADIMVVVGDLAVPLDGGPVTIAGVPVRLSRREQEVLRLIAIRYPRQVSKSTIYDALFALSDAAPHLKVIDSHIHNLRRKLTAADRHGRDFIETSVGLGYRLGLPRK